MNIEFSERLVPESAPSDVSLPAPRLRLVAGALGVLSVALLAALIAVCVALTNKATMQPQTAMTPQFAISRQAFGQYTRIVIRNHGAHPIPLD